MRRFVIKGQRRVRPVIGVLLVTVLLLTSVLVGAASVSADSVAWRGEFYNNVSLAGSPVLVRDDGSINFDWGSGSPGTGVNADAFSVRWTTFSSFAAGDYTFQIVTDDGARLWVDDQLVIDQWHDQAPTTYAAGVYLSAGYHSVRLEYYDNTGNAKIQLTWSAGAPAITNWRGEYYNNTSLGGIPVVVRDDSSINFDWGYGSPAVGVNADYFSVRWTKSVSFSTAGTYVFSATTDDGIRVWVDSGLVIDKWFPQARTTYTGSVYLAAGTHQVKVEYYEATGTAVCAVSWAAGTAPTAQEVIVDNKSTGFLWGGPSSSWYQRNTGYNGHLYWTWNGTTTMHNWGKWMPNLPSAGDWAVYVYIPNRYHGSKSATYKIQHNGVQNTKTISQNDYNNQWVSLGTYYFAGGDGEYVYLGDNTGEAYATRFVGWDAVKWVKVGGGSPAPTPVPGPGPSCAIEPVLGFGRVWTENALVSGALGCPSEAEQYSWAGEQEFQGGYAFWREDTKDIYVFYDTGTWARYDDTWTSSEPEWDPSIVPPAGYYQPKRGFGKVWRENTAVRNGLGWGTTEERGFFCSAQTFQGGMMLWSDTHGIYVLYSNGTWAQYY